MQPEDFNARSWLFVPGDSERKMEKAAASAADIVLLDLEDAVSEEAKPKARSMVSALLAAHPQERARLWVRINPLRGPHALGDLAAVMVSRPGGIMLPKADGRADIELLSHFLSALEVVFGINEGSTRVIALTAEAGEAMFTMGTYAGAPRLVALSWGAEDLATALGSARGPDGSYGFAHELARSLCLVGAAAAGVAAIEAVYPDFGNEAGLRKRAERVRGEGFRGMLAIHPAQVPVINEAFTPSAEEVVRAQDIVNLFGTNPGVGTIGYKGVMLDRPHLARAQALLRLVARSRGGNK